MRWSTSFPVPSCEGMPQVMPAKIMDVGPQQGITPCLGVDLDDGVSLVDKNVRRVITLPPLQHRFGAQRGERVQLFACGN